MNTYRGLHAAYYDVIYADKPYAEEARFVANLIAGEGTGDPWRLLFDSVGYLVTNDAIVEGLDRARRHLTAEGTLAVEFLHAPAVLRHASPVRVRRWPTREGGTLLRISEVEFDTAHQTMHVDYELLDVDSTGTAVSRWTEAQDNRYFSVEEMRALFQSAGLTTRFVPAYLESETLDDQAWHVIAVARPA